MAEPLVLGCAWERPQAAVSLFSRSIPISMMPVSMVRVGFVGIRPVSTLLKRGIRAGRHLTVTVAARGCVRSEVGQTLRE